ncbi:MAG: hypothetical protein J6T80_01995 [Paludibacteraceae bacterium]|nr:hypothetical protein [Paludibacteraceae bacterium]
MKRINVYLSSILCILFSVSAFAQNDSALNRSVTVERDFQPVIQAAGKVATKPEVMETTIEPAPIEFSDYIAEVTPGTSFNPLLSQPTRFEKGERYRGYVRAALGHPNTLLDFDYRIDDGKKSILDVYAHHRGQWDAATLSKTTLGMNYMHPFSACTLYFGVNGGNIYYHKYGHFYDYSLINPSMWLRNDIAYPKPRTIGALDKTSLWTAEAFIGVRSNPKQDFQYRFQTGYMLFSKPESIAEHQIRTHADFDWHSDAHHVGANIYVQNNLLQLTGLAKVIPDSMYSHCHDIRLEPYYAYDGTRVQLHLGVNLDMNIGAGHNSLSGVEHLSFAPSPHIRLEAQIAKQWLTIYADVLGNHGSGSLQDYMEENRYCLIHHGVIDHHFTSYTPVDAELGFHIKPYRDLLIEIHGGYAYMINQTNLIANTDSAMYAPLNMKLFQAGDFDYFYADYQRGKVGGQLNYHYRDLVRVNLHGDYFFWRSDTTVYDRPNWELALRIDGRIDKHWSLYSDNYFAGARRALAYNGITDTYSEHTLRPTIELNLGVQYDMLVGKAKANGNQSTGDNLILRPEPKPNLTLFFQLNNWLHRKNEIYYGYRSQGINCLAGVTFRF